MENPLATQATVRDSFAMVGLSIALTVAVTKNVVPTFADLAADAYGLADAMMRARNVSE